MYRSDKGLHVYTCMCRTVCIIWNEELMILRQLKYNDA